MNRPSRNVTLLVGAFATLLLALAPTRAQRPADRAVELVNGREAISGEVLVKFRDTPRPDQLNAIRGLADAQSMRPLGRSGVQRLQSRSMSATTLLQQLANHPDILYAEPNYLIHTFAEPNEPAFPYLWGLFNTGQSVNNGWGGIAGADIHAVPAWDLSFGSTTQVVAVIDTGIDYRHPDLADNMWSAPASFQVTIEDTTITCQAGTHGFNVIARTCNPQDDHEHGTHVSGTIGASGNNGQGIVGVNWITQLMGIKILDENGSGTMSDAIAGVDLAIQAQQAFATTSGANVRVVSASWGDTDFSQALLDEINAANDANMLFVAAAGNSAVSNDVSPTYPASFDAPNIISVAATTNTDTRAWFSNYGASSVHLGAPGTDIFSTAPHNQYAFRSGTSMATPHVSGAAALVLSRCALDTAALKDTLLSTVEPVSSLASTTITGGRLDLNSAIRSCSAPPAAPTALSALGGNGQVILNWTGAAGALSFNVKRSLAAGGPYTLIKSGVKGKTYTDTAVVNDTTYYYVVSATNTLGESGDSNEASATPKVPSDLVVSALTVPSKGGAGTPLTFSSTTKNQGAGASNPSTTRFYLSENSTLGASDILLNGVQAVQSLPPGATSVASVTVDIPPDTTVGTHYLVAKADADNLEVETQESNNTMWRLVTIGPELVVSLTGPSTAAPGGAILATDAVKNQGGAEAGATTTRFYLSTDNDLDATDLVLSASRSVPGLAAGATSSGSTSVVIPATVTTGSYYLIAKADADNSVLESLESNNDDLILLQIGGDLTVSSLSGPSTAGAGSAIVVSDTTKNEGAGPVSASTTRFYLSTTIQLGASATLLAESRAVPDLAAGATSVGSTTIVVPSTIATGSYYLIAKADGPDVVQETRENNNTSSRTIKIGGDLVVSGLTAPATAGAGSAITIGETTKNVGAGSVAASTTRFYLSANAALDGADTLLSGGRAVPGLAAGASSAGSTTVTIPSTVSPGSYYVIAKADADNAAAETEEANNTALRSLPVGGDLAVSALTVPAKGGAGLAIAVSDTTINKGAGSVAASVTRFYLSKNSTLDTADTLLPGSRAVPSLVAGASSSGSTTVTLPSPLDVGSYYVIAKSDGDNSVDESQETNNTLARSIAVGPDFTISSVSVTFDVAAGSTVPVTDVVLNQGGEAAGGTTTRFFLSANVLFDANDLPLDGSRVVPALAAGASSTGSTPVTIPASTAPGYYYVIALSDADGVVTEASESNNAGARTIRVAAAP
jgi:subtilisin family serine protease